MMQAGLSKADDILNRIESSQLAVLRTGLLQANIALLSASNLQSDCSDRLLELLISQLCVSRDGTLRQTSCQALFFVVFPSSPHKFRMVVFSSSQVLYLGHCSPCLFINVRVDY